MIESIGGFHFSSNFDSGNLARVAKVEKHENEFNLWTLPDCANTDYENGNRTWFYFSVRGPGNASVKLNLMNLNRQAKLYSQGMRPLYRILPQQPQWDRIKERPTHYADDHAFILSFRFTMPSDENATVYFAFCYPYSYTELQQDLYALDTRFADNESNKSNIFYRRDLLCHSLEHRRVDVLTVTSKGDENLGDKPVVFVSARVHPGETPSSFVLKGFLDFVLRENDIRAQKLREKFVFKIVPMLNPDGVYRGHYRTDSRGVNLNRVYLTPRPEEHPSIAATKQLILSLTPTKEEGNETGDILSVSNLENQVKENLSMMVSKDDSSLFHDDSAANWPTISFSKTSGDIAPRTDFSGLKFGNSSGSAVLDSSIIESAEDGDVSSQYFVDGSPAANTNEFPDQNKKSRLFAYIDLHGHASKRGIFMYGNHFKDPKEQVECLLLPKLISLNSQHFDFWACNFTEKNMYLKDKRDGLSKEGSGRVAVYKLTGIVPSYTLECNYNTGRMRNALCPLPADKFPLFHATTDDTKDELVPFEDSLNRRRRTVSTGSGLTESFLPAVPYTEQSFQEVGEALAVSILDLIGANPMSRLSQSIFGDVEGVRQWIRCHCLGQKRFQFVETDLDDASAGSHVTSAPQTDRDRSQQVNAASASKLESAGGDGSSRMISAREKIIFSPPKCTSAGQATTNSGGYRVRVPWPSSSRYKETPNQHQSSPKSACTKSQAGTAGVALGQSSSTVTDFTPTSPPPSPPTSVALTVPFSSSLHFPKQQKSPSTPRRVPRKKSLRKSKVHVKKEVGAVAAESSEMDCIDHSMSTSSSPPKVVLKRKRRKSRNSLGDNIKEKRKMKMATTSATVDAGFVIDSDDPLPSTSTSSPSSSRILRSPLIKKKKMIRKKKTSSFKGKKRSALPE